SMSTLLTCPQGHQWELTGDARSKTRATCPICGVTVPLVKHARSNNRPIDVVAPARQSTGSRWIIAAVAAVSLVVMLVFTVVGIIFIRQLQSERDSARTEKAEADRLRDTADRQRAQADQPRPAAAEDLSLLQQTVDNYATRVTEDLQLRDEDWRTLRAELLA